MNANELFWITLHDPEVLKPNARALLEGYNKENHLSGQIMISDRTVTNVASLLLAIGQQKIYESNGIDKIPEQVKAAAIKGNAELIKYLLAGEAPKITEVILNGSKGPIKITFPPLVSIAVDALKKEAGEIHKELLKVKKGAPQKGINKVITANLKTIHELRTDGVPFDFLARVLFDMKEDAFIKAIQRGT